MKNNVKIISDSNKSDMIIFLIRKFYRMIKFVYSNSYFNRYVDYANVLNAALVDYFTNQGILYNEPFKVYDFQDAIICNRDNSIVIYVETSKVGLWIGNESKLPKYICNELEHKYLKQIKLIFVNTATSKYRNIFFREM